jgi:hypothetical protein
MGNQNKQEGLTMVVIEGKIWIETLTDLISLETGQKVRGYYLGELEQDPSGGWVRTPTGSIVYCKAVFNFAEVDNQTTVFSAVTLLELYGLNIEIL